MTTSYYKDNIVAIASAPENGAIGVIRLSGPDAKVIQARVFRDTSNESLLAPKPRYLHYGHLVGSDGQVLDQCLMAFMKGPHSFTGEDVVEWQCHGNLILLKRIINCLLALAPEFELRAALGGEFTKRAYLNGKIDLTQAEAVHEVITASCDAALDASLSNLDGYLKSSIQRLIAKLKHSCCLVEAGFEFSEEDIQTYDVSVLKLLIDESGQELTSLISAFQTSKLYDHGVHVALLGRPNVGKSSLLNALLVEDRAIVTAQAGTTRDVVEGSKIIGGIRYIFRDTAGLRKASDAIESIGIEKSKEWAHKSDVIFLIDDGLGAWDFSEFDLDMSSKSLIYILNKSDLLDDQQAQIALDQVGSELSKSKIAVSALTGKGIEDLEVILKDSLSGVNNVQNNVHVNQRQYDALVKALDGIMAVKSCFQVGHINEEILAEELRHVILSLEDVTGAITGDDVLGEIFKRFCIGK